MPRFMRWKAASKMNRIDSIVADLIDGAPNLGLIPDDRVQELDQLNQAIHVYQTSGLMADLQQVGALANKLRQQYRLLDEIYQTINAFQNSISKDDLQQVDALAGKFQQQYRQLERVHQAIALYQASGLMGDLQRVDVMADNLRQQYRQDPENANQAFMVWHMQGHIHRELARLYGDVHLPVDNQKMFAELATAQEEVPSIGKWKKTTTSKRSLLTLGLFRFRSVQYKEIDPFVQAVKLAEANQLDPANPDQALIETIKNLLAKLLVLDIPENKPQRTKRINHLINQANAMLNRVMEQNPQEKARHMIEPPPLIDPLLHKSHEDFISFAGHLASSDESLTIDEYDIIKLGGNNNKNWKLINRETGKIQVIRVEKADDPITQYAMIDATRSSSDLGRFLAKDAVFYPTGDIEISKGYTRPFNIAVCEYCPDGDLCRYRNSLEGKNVYTIMMEVADMTLEAAKFAAALYRQGKIYADFKGENFLRPPVKTADLKSIVPVFDNTVRKEDISTTEPYAPPEYLYGPKQEHGIIQFTENILEMSSEALNEFLWNKSAYALCNNQAYFIDNNRYYINQQSKIIPLNLGPEALEQFKKIVPKQENTYWPVIKNNQRFPDRTPEKITLITGHAHHPPAINAEKFMCYQIGLQMYILAINPQGEAKHTLHQSLRERLPLNFDHTIFKSRCGQKMQRLIEAATQVDPDLRLSLDEILDQCQRLITRLDMQIAFQPSDEKVITPPKPW